MSKLNERLDIIMANLSAAIAQVDPSIQQKPYNYFINTDESFNAFCSLGHNISVNTGMFNLVANDAEIAVVLGHEMGHGQKEHVRKSLKGTLNASILGSIVAEATGVQEPVVRRMIREGRFLSSGVELFYPCEKCGSPIQKGQYCEKCQKEMREELTAAVAKQSASGMRTTSDGSSGRRGYVTLSDK